MLQKDIDYNAMHSTIYLSVCLFQKMFTLLESFGTSHFVCPLLYIFRWEGTFFFFVKQPTKASDASVLTTCTSLLPFYATTTAEEFRRCPRRKYFFVDLTLTTCLDHFVKLVETNLFSVPTCRQVRQLPSLLCKLRSAVAQ